MHWIFYVTTVFAGLFVGSFLNVVIHRGPALWGLTDEKRARGDFWGPRSYCTDCKAQIRAADLFPVASYFILGGKCRACGATIPARYPAVELSGATAALASILLFGFTISALFAFLFFAALIALAFIDDETGYLPDAITLPLIALGLAVNAFGLFVPFRQAVIGAACGYVSFRLLAETYKAIRKREGLGGGDAKLLAAIGAWCGWTLLPATVFFASLAALAYLAAVSAVRGSSLRADAVVRFGPALCIGGALALTVLKAWPIEVG